MAFVYDYFFKKPFRDFANAVVNESKQFGAQVSALNKADQKAQSKMLQLCYYRSWQDPETSLSVSLALTNQIAPLSFYESPQPYSYDRASNQFYISEVIKANIDAKSLTEEKQKQILALFQGAFATNVQLLPVAGKEKEGIYDISALSVQNSNLKEDELRNVINTFHTNVLNYRKKLDAILNGTGQINENPVNIATDSGNDLNETEKYKAPKLMYDNQKSFVKTLADRIEYWKKNSDEPTKDKYPTHTGVLANPIYASQCSVPNQVVPLRSTVRIGWSTINPEKIELRAPLGSVFSAPFQQHQNNFDPQTQKFTQYFERLESAVSGSFEGVRMYAGNHLSRTDFWMRNNFDIVGLFWFYEVCQTEDLKILDKKSKIIHLCEKIRRLVPALPTIPTQTEALNKTETDVKTEQLVMIDRTSDSKWTQRTKELLQNYTNYYQQLVDKNILEMAKTWPVQLFNFDQFVDLYKVRTVTYQGMFNTQYAEVSRTLTLPINYQRFSEDDQTKLSDFLRTYAASLPDSYSPVIRVVEDSYPNSSGSTSKSNKLMQFISFELIALSKPFTGNTEADAKALQDTLTLMDSKFYEVQNALMEALPSHAREEITRYVKPLNYSDNQQSVEETTGLAALTKAFNELDLPDDCRTSFTLMRGTGTSSRPYSLMYDQQDDQYLLRGVLMNPVLFMNVSRKIQNKMREFCTQKQYQDMQVSLVNSEGLVAGSIPCITQANTAMVAELTVDVRSAAHFDRKLKKFRRELNQIQFD